MNWAGLNEFLSMGGYAVYVWGSYAAAALCIALELALLGRRRRAAARTLGAQQAQ